MAKSPRMQRRPSKNVSPNSSVSSPAKPPINAREKRGRPSTATTSFGPSQPLVSMTMSTHLSSIRTNTENLKVRSSILLTSSNNNSRDHRTNNVYKEDKIIVQHALHHAFSRQ
ncbi:hypothetical protein RJ641_011102 [Dillenia turbinata]|uniref:Uncharacterized protein n=1 Tax=Dillenia turbinata TaxID=194707 RepID=A0AAN8V7Q6_9MAGN